MQTFEHKNTIYADTSSGLLRIDSDGNEYVLQCNGFNYQWTKVFLECESTFQTLESKKVEKPANNLPLF